jgi:hypothetical protein
VNRRGFLGSILAGAMAPAIVRASSLMKLAPGFEVAESGLIVPAGDGGLLTIDQITREALRVFMAQNTFVNSVSRSYTGFDFPSPGPMRIRMHKRSG